MARYWYSGAAYRDTRELLDEAIREDRLERQIRDWAESGELARRLPEIEALRGVEQPPAFHAEGDVFEHTMLVLRNAPRTERGQIAALLHDIGKPATQEFIEDKIRFLGHEGVGAEMAAALLTRLGYDAETIDCVAMMVRQHMRPHLFDKLSARKVRRFLRDVGDYFEDVLALAEADACGALGPGGQPAKGTRRYEELRERARGLKPAPRAKPKEHERVLTGDEVRRILGIAPGPEVGAALRWLAEQGVADRAEAERLLREEY